jgi:hypothetical protein
VVERNLLEEEYTVGINVESGQGDSRGRDYFLFLQPPGSRWRWKTARTSISSGSSVKKMP